MSKEVSISYIQGLLAKRPSGHRLVVMLKGHLFEVDRIRYGALVVRSAKDFQLTDDELMETEEREITSYWYVEEGNV
jgi:hypothetical protein